MAVSIPELDNSFFVNILQMEENAKGRSGLVSVLGYTLESCFNDYCNFLNTVLRVSVEYKISCQDENEILVHSFIVKIPFPDSNRNESILIENELQMYTDFIPKLSKISVFEIAPKYWMCSWNNCLVTEDLEGAGYEKCKPGSQLDYKQAKAALISLAKFHAGSVVMKHNDPECLERNGIETYYTQDPKHSTLFKSRILMRLYGLASVLKTIKNCEKFGDILIDAGEEFWDLMVEVFRPSNKLNVLNHGDFWKNNILFKHNSAELISDVKFINYHMRHYCSPAIDLLCLFWTSADFGVRMKMYELLEMYRHTLNSCLAELGCSERLLRQELKEEISKRSSLILLLCLYLPVIFPDPNYGLNLSQSQHSEKDMSSFDFDVNPLLLVFKGKNYRTALLEMCKELENMKIFQILVKNKKEK